MLTEIMSNEGLEGKHEIFYRNRNYYLRIVSNVSERTKYAKNTIQQLTAKVSRNTVAARLLFTRAALRWSRLRMIL